jgi:hypothetical protein
MVISVSNPIDFIYPIKLSPSQIKAHENIVVYTYVKATYQLRYPFLGGVEGLGRRCLFFVTEW